MKQTSFLSILLLVLGVSAFAQGYTPLVVDNAHWHVEYEDWGPVPPHHYVYEYYSKGDTTLGDTSYKKIYRRYFNEIQPPYTISGSESLVALLREDTAARKVYAIQFQKLRSTCPIDEEFLLYDFSMQPGDTLKECFGLTLNIASHITNEFISYIHNGSDSVKTIHFYNDPVFKQFEGVGSWQGLFESKNTLHVRLKYYCKGTDWECEILTGVERPESEKFRIYPNPVSDELSLLLRHPLKTVDISIIGMDRKTVLAEKDVPQILTNGPMVMDVSTLNNGIYAIRIMTETGETISHKFSVYR